MEDHSFEIAEDMDIVVRNGQIKKAIVSAPINFLIQNTLERKLRAGEVDMEIVPEGTLAYIITKVFCLPSRKQWTRATAS